MNCNVGCGCSYIIGLFKSFKKKPVPQPEPPKPVQPITPTPVPTPAPQPAPVVQDRTPVTYKVVSYDIDRCFFSYRGGGNSDQGSESTYLDSAYVWVTYTTYNATEEAIETKREYKMYTGSRRPISNPNCGKALEETLGKAVNRVLDIKFFNMSFRPVR